MARPNKIESLNLQQFVANCLERGMSVRQIAIECTRKAKEEISPMAISRYIERMDTKREEVKKNPEKLQDIVNFDVDVIKLQYRTTSALLERFQMLDSLPEMFRERMTEIESVAKEGAVDKEYLKAWKEAFYLELRRNVQLLATVNRELRENSKFMVEMREKAYDFSLYEEYLFLFMEVFRKASPEAYEIAEQQIASNPRMLRIVEQQQRLKGYEEA